MTHINSKKLEDYLVTTYATISCIIEKLNENASGIVVVVDDQKKLIGTITDGDVRRAFLEGSDMTVNALEVMRHKDPHAPAKPVHARQGDDDASILHMMTSDRLRQIPILDDEGRVVDIVLLEDLVQDGEDEIAAVLMAGGFGKRLHPMTAETPKPMLELAGRPIMEHIVDQLRESGIGRLSVTTHYRSEKITDHFGNGEDFGIKINYVQEDNPLGTAGGLGGMDKPSRPVLVMNGDILTKLNFRMFSTFHMENDAMLTVAVRPYEHTVPFGVMAIDGARVTGIEEKPKNRWMVNAGIYILDPDVFDYIPREQHFDMPDLMQKLIDAGHKVVCFPLHEYWRDIGRPEDFKGAEQDLSNGLEEN